MGHLTNINLKNLSIEVTVKSDMIFERITMELHLDLDPHIFLKSVSQALESEATVHSFILSLASRHIEIKRPMALMARAVKSNGEVVAAGIQTDSDRVLIISKISAADAEQFALLLSQKLDVLPGVNGPALAVDHFVKTWAALKKTSATLCSNLRLFELDAVVNPRMPVGFARPARSSDRDILFRWLRAFRDEAVPHDPAPNDADLFKSIDAGIAQAQFFVWEVDGKITSLVGSRRETLTERWIAPVYTPPELRGQGYGSALTAYASKRILDSGKRGVLFTDLANPTSNGIYQSIGYKPVADFKHYSFS